MKQLFLCLGIVIINQIIIMYFIEVHNSSKLLKQIKKNSKKSPHNYCLTSVTHARHDKTHSMHALSPLLFLGNDDLRAGLTARMFYSYKIRITIW